MGLLRRSDLVCALPAFGCYGPPLTSAREPAMNLTPRGPALAIRLTHTSKMCATSSLENLFARYLLPPWEEPDYVLFSKSEAESSWSSGDCLPFSFLSAPVRFMCKLDPTANWATEGAQVSASMTR